MDPGESKQVSSNVKLNKHHRKKRNQHTHTDKGSCKFTCVGCVPYHLHKHMNHFNRNANCESEKLFYIYMIYFIHLSWQI